MVPNALMRGNEEDGAYATFFQKRALPVLLKYPGIKTKPGASGKMTSSGTPGLFEIANTLLSVIGCALRNPLLYQTDLSLRQRSASIRHLGPASARLHLCSLQLGQQIALVR